jgi:hypothetical protein
MHHELGKRNFYKILVDKPHEEITWETNCSLEGDNVAEAVSCGHPTQWPWLEPESGHVEFVVNRAALGQVFSEYFSFPCLSFHAPHKSSSNIWGWYSRPVVASVIADSVPLHPKKEGTIR